MYKKVTPVLLVDAIEPVIPFWEALGFARTAEVPHGDRLGFLILAADGIEVMYQTFDSVRADEPRSLEGPRAPGAAMVYIEVADFDAVSKRVPARSDVIVAKRTTFYGATEMFLRDPAGNVIGFAQMG